ncbi:CG13919 [Drosophila busckii]|uniref:CG13919 n=1 Tax=Drosophila busckii TaxID=30019 RepID=A0A0M4EZE4_DROBS|nr:transmembrane protein 60 [Drosophila busckii]ALC43745.1 CG13919 [Drosophila busckii]
MTLAHRALFTWFIVLVFLILLCLRLDPRTTWNWFVTFTPLWFFDCILIIYVIIKFIRKWRNLNRLTDLLFHYKWSIGGVLLTITSQVMICMTLEYPQQIPIYVTMAPLVLLLSTAIFYVGNTLYQREGLIGWLH